MAKLVKLILDSGLALYATVIPADDYKAVFPASGDLDPYYLALKHVLLNLGEMGVRMQANVKCWVEESHATSGKAMQIYLDLKMVKSWAARTHLTGFGALSKKVVPLQAADLVAREAFKHILNLGSRPQRKPLKVLGGRSHFHLWTKEALEYLKRNGGPDDLELLTSWGYRHKDAPPIRNFAPLVYG